MKPPVFHRMFDYDKRLLPNAHLASLEEGVGDVEEARERSGATIGYPGWGLIYHLMLSHLDRGREETIIETGTNGGCTTLVLAQALIDAGCAGRVITFELETDNADVAARNHEAAGVKDRIEQVVGDVHETFAARLATFRAEDGLPIRFAFLDASHLLPDVMFEFETLLPYLADDALVLFDNTYRIADEGEDPRVNGALKAIADTHGGNLVNLEFVSWFTPGLAIWQKTPKL